MKIAQYFLLQSLTVPNLHYKFPQQHAKVLIMRTLAVLFVASSYPAAGSLWEKIRNRHRQGLVYYAFQKINWKLVTRLNMGPFRQQQMMGPQIPNRMNEWLQFSTLGTHARRKSPVGTTRVSPQQIPGVDAVLGALAPKVGPAALVAVEWDG